MKVRVILARCSALSSLLAVRIKNRPHICLNPPYLKPAELELIQQRSLGPNRRICPDKGKRNPPGSALRSCLPRSELYLHNLIDTDAGQLFNGGDKVTVYYVPMPHRPVILDAAFLAKLLKLPSMAI